MVCCRSEKFLLSSYGQGSRCETRSSVRQVLVLMVIYKYPDTLEGVTCLPRILSLVYRKRTALLSAARSDLPGAEKGDDPFYSLLRAHVVS